MAVKKKPKTRSGSTAVMKRPPSHEEVIRRALARIPEIDAVFVLTDESGTIHVFSVAQEFRAQIYDRLLKKERAIEKKFPDRIFEFHVRAHQGREPAQAVPFEAELVYAR